jgi:NADP-dependent 3-hydroxy acid dehydrogenase YdfG
MSVSNFNTDTPTDLTGLGVIITGGTTGIGRATAILLAQKGANVLITGQSSEHLDEALESIKETGPQGNFDGITADLATKEGVEAVFNKADETIGNLDVLINNAALAYQGVSDGGYEDWERVVKTNLLGYIGCTRGALDRMTQQGRGHVILIGSMSADVRETGSSIYVATKAGIQGFAEAVRKEVNEKGIKVTLIEPGAVGTDMQPANTDEQQQNQENLEMLKAEDIAAAIIYTLQQPFRCDVVELKIRPHLQLI